MKRDGKKLQRKVTNFGICDSRSLPSSSSYILGVFPHFAYFLFLASALIFFSFQANAQVTAADAVTQGQRKNLAKQSRWTGSAQWVMQKNQDYYSDYFSGLNLGVGYTYNPTYTFYGQFGYSQPLSENPEKVERYGVSDTEFGVNTSPFYKNKYNFQVSATSAITLPTSEISKRASLNGSLTGGLVTTTPLQFGFRVSTIHSVTVNSYTYETSNAMGTDFNNPYSTSNVLTGSWTYKNFYTSLSGGWTYLKDYADTDINIQSLRSAMGYSFPTSTRVEVYGRWRDRTISNNAAFADGKTFFGMLLTVNI